MMYSPQDLFRDIPNLIGENKVHGIVELDSSFTLLIRDKYGNEDTTYSIVVDKHSGKVMIVGRDENEDEEDIQLQCTGDDTDERYFELDAKVPEEYATYGIRVIYELCDSAETEVEGVQRLIALQLMLESTTFKDVDYSTMRNIAEMYIAEFEEVKNGRIHEICNMTLEQKIEEAKKYV